METDETKNITIRRAEMKDVFHITYIMKKATLFLPSSAWFVSDDEEFIKRHLDNEGLILLALVEEEIAGYLMIRIPKEALDNLGRDLEMAQEEWMCVAHMESIAILPKFRGRKLAGKLLVKGEELIRQKGCRHLLATVHPDNLASLHNFERLGYHKKKKVIKYGGKERLILYKKVRVDKE